MRLFRATITGSQAPLSGPAGDGAAVDNGARGEGLCPNVMAKHKPCNRGIDVQPPLWEGA
jgi:hypothetical protein